MSRIFGTLPDGREVTEHVLEHPGGIRLTVLDLGATVNSVRLVGDDPATEVAIGFDSLDRQQAATAYFGSVVGRYANRIAGGRFTLDGVEHQVTQNEGETTLHGGLDGFNARTWRVVEASAQSLVLELVSPDGDQGFPGQVTAQARYSLLDKGFRLELEATTDAPTVCWLTSHLYLNLAGHGSIDEHLLQVDADGYVPIDAHSIPLGRVDDVSGTPFDLRTSTAIGAAVRTDDPQVGLAKGIDHSFAVNGSGFRRHARIECPANGRSLELWSDQPALQVYTGNFLDGEWVGHFGDRMRQGDAIALEPHQHPDSPNQNWEPSPVLRPGQVWTWAAEWRFEG